MIIKQELSLQDFQAWSGAVSTLDRIIEKDKCEELECILDDLYPDGMTDGELNDLLWFDSESVFEWLGISEEEETEFTKFCNENMCNTCKYSYCLSMSECEEEFTKDNE